MFRYNRKQYQHRADRAEGSRKRSTATRSQPGPLARRSRTQSRTATRRDSPSLRRKCYTHDIAGLGPLTDIPHHSLPGLYSSLHLLGHERLQGVLGDQAAAS